MPTKARTEAQKARLLQMQTPRPKAVLKTVVVICKNGHRVVAGAKNVSFEASEQQCDSCGSHGHINLGVWCGQCKAHITVELSGW